MVLFGYVLPTRGIIMGTKNASVPFQPAINILDLASSAESLGFSSLWVGDSVLTRHRLEPLTTLASVAASTNKIQIGTAIYLLHLRHPVHVAHATATLDRLSNGRFIMGVGSGTNHESNISESTNLGIRFSERGKILNKSLDIVTQLWNGETVSSSGVYNFKNAYMDLPPLREPPIYVAVTQFDKDSGFPLSIQQRIKKHANGLMPQTHPSQYSSMIAHARDLLKTSGRNPSTFQATNYTDVVISETEEEAFSQAKDYLSYYYPWTIPDAHLKKVGVFGPPEMVSKKINSFIDAGVEHFIIRFPTFNQKNQIELFADLFNL
jgi:alkanesulfonate monooxygenase SsuD/methylene tetrahydromethanopterin reductase-like flavin-dependent oxidoreductase (luciferase family)